MTIGDMLVTCCCTGFKFSKFSLPAYFGGDLLAQLRRRHRLKAVYCSVPTATHCIPLKHTTTYCIGAGDMYAWHFHAVCSLSHNVSHCIPPQRIATHCNTMHPTVSHHNTLHLRRRHRREARRLLLHRL